MTSEKEIIRIKIRKYGDPLFSILIFDKESENMVTLLAKIRKKLGLQNTFNILHL